MSTQPTRRARSRLAAVVATLLALLLLSGCAGWSARVTIVPAHQAYDVDLIMAGIEAVNGPQIEKACEALGSKSGISRHDGNVYCELHLTIPIDANQTFVERKGEHWTFHMTSKSLYEFVAHALPGVQQEYPNGFTEDVFDDFKLMVDMPGKVVAHNGTTLQGSTVSWTDKKQLFATDGLHAESQEQPTWKYVMGAVGALGALALIGGIVFSFVGYGRSRGATRTWPPAHVVEWWERNGERWLRRRDGDR